MPLSNLVNFTGGFRRTVFVKDSDFKNVLAVLLTGLPFNLIHAATTALVLFFAGKPMSDKLFRLHEKYGIFSLEEN